MSPNYFDSGREPITARQLLLLLKSLTAEDLDKPLQCLHSAGCAHTDIYGVDSEPDRVLLEGM